MWVADENCEKSQGQRVDVYKQGKYSQTII